MDNRRQSGLWDQTAEGHYERKAPPGPFQYYQPPTSAPDRRRSYSERAAGLDSPTDEVTSDPLKAATQNGLVRATSARKSEALPNTHKKLDKMRTSLPPYDDGTREGRTGRRADEPAYRPESPQSLASDDSIPANLRTKTWSPEPNSPISPTVAGPRASLPTRHASNASEGIRQGSVPAKSPLQDLEAKLGGITKEEKRARVAEAERRAQYKGAAGEHSSDAQLARSATLRSEKPRVLSDGSRRANGSVRRDDRHFASAETSPTEPTNGPRQFHRASDALRNSGRGGAGPSTQEPQSQASEQQPPGQGDTPTSIAPATSVNRSQSQKYRHRARDAGFVGAAAAMSGATPDNAAARGKAAHERRKSQTGELSRTPTTPNAPDRSADVPRSRSNKLQKDPQSRVQSREVKPTNIDLTANKKESPAIKGDGKHELHESRMGTGNSRSKEIQPEQQDPLPRDAVRTEEGVAVPYKIPPQTAAARQAKERVTFAPDVAENDQTGEKQHHGLRNLFGNHIEARGYQSKVKPLEEWRGADVAKLSTADIVLDDDQGAPGAERGSAWWEKHAARTQAPTQSGQAYEEKAVSFDPPLFLKSGPLLRFTGIRKPKGGASGIHTWRGSILIVTEDEHSDLTKPPTLRLFAQDSALYHRPPHTSQEQHDEKHDDDAITGLIKTSRTGRPIYVRSLNDIEHGVDLSRTENNRGLFSASQPAPKSQHAARIPARDGERLGVYRDIRAHRLHVEHGCTFWRFNLEVELGPRQSRVAYRINNGPAVGFWIPARGETMNIMFHSCNGFSLSVDSKEFCGPDPLWRDVLNRHQSRPFHVMIGGGDQIYNDAAIRDTTHFKEWLQIKNPDTKHHADFTPEMQEELEHFFFDRYAMWFSQGFFGMANAQIPMVNIYDDHDIIDGFGSYPHHFMSSPVFTGLGAVAFKYYLLFQQQSLPSETTKEEPSWLLGASPGPYINELNRSIFVWLGDKVALLALDCRTERMRDEILSQQSYDIIFDRCRDEIIKGHTRHLIVLLGVPIAYPRLNFLENILTSRVMDPIKALGRTGMLGGFVNKFDGGVEILDDLDDHWTAKHHKQERNWFVQELQELAAERSVRVTILGGDVHLGAVGQFYSNKALGIPKDQDHRYMPNVISSAIVNTPPPPMMADVLNKRNKVHHLDHETDEDMIPMFDHDVDFSKRNNKRLLPRRNFAIIKEYVPGSTPPPTPPPMDRPSYNSLNDDTAGDHGYNAPSDQARPGVRRSLSLTRGSSKLIRRLSLRGKNPPVSLNSSQPRRPFSFHEDTAGSKEHGAFQRADSMTHGSENQRPSLSFHRRPTNLSLKEARKAAAKGGPSAEDDDEYVQPGHINLEGGLDISLCMEVDQHDPSGHTIPYRLLVPALWYEGPGDRNTLTLPKRERQSIFKRLTSVRKPKNQEADREREYQESYSEESFRSNSPALPTGAQVGAHNAHVDRKRELEDMQATAAGAGNSARYGTSGAFGQPHTAYQKGYDLGSPPLGKASMPEQQSRPGQARQPMQQEGYFDDRPSEGSFTGSEAQTEEYEQDQYEHDNRRTSKAERFFGIGSGNEGTSRNGGGGVLRKKSQGPDKAPRWKQLFNRGGTRDEVDP